jgi:hypothetical protein
MGNPEIRSLPIAVRVFPVALNAEAIDLSHKSWRWPEAMLVFDTESTVDASQRLTFGSYRFIVGTQCLEEGLFYADDLLRGDRHVLEEYVATHRADTHKTGVRQLKLLTQSEFLKLFYASAYKARVLVVGFNLPFDLSRLAFNFPPARDRYAGGFCLQLWWYVDSKGRKRPRGYRPGIDVKHIDSKRSLIAFAGRFTPDEEDLIPEGSLSGEQQEKYVFPGYFLDLRTLAFALTDKGYSLEAACETFGVAHPKYSARDHGVVTPEYIDYNRRDVLATSELARKLIAEYRKHPITVAPTHALSPASIGKGYLRAMGIEPIFGRQPGFNKKYLGYAETAFWGGRTSVHVRKVVCPVVYVDFLSMYSTINALMSLWQFVKADKIRVVEHCEQELEQFLRELNHDMLFNPETWKHMAGFIQVVPNGDILPVRAKYSVASNDWGMGINHLYGAKEDALWFSIPDVIASVLLTGRVPEIVDAFRIEPSGTSHGLTPTKLGGTVKIDPRKQDFFKTIVEERIRASSRAGLSAQERERLEKGLKVLANVTSFGIWAQMDREESDEKVKVTCYGVDAEPFECSVAHPDLPGEFLFSPLASLITGGARLMMALLEIYVTKELGGTFVMEDTDSMTVVATERGEIVRCPGGPLDMNDGHSAIRSLSWKQVEEIAAHFARLNPYGVKLNSILKIERDNFDPITGKQRQIYCFAISAKRYALFLLDKQGNPVVLQKGANNHENRWSEHGLGHLRNPTDLESEDRDWIRQTWTGIIRRALGLPTQPLTFEHLPAVGRVTITSPAMMRPLEKVKFGKRKRDRLRPFNFLLSCHVKQFGYPVGVDPERFHLIAPYEPNPSRWLEMPWINQHNTKERYQITTSGFHGGRGLVRVKTYGDVLREYEFHPVSKSADAKHKASGKQTIGLLQRRHIRIAQVIHIGKESNRLEEVESGLIHSAQSVYTEYPDPRRDEFQAKVLPLLKRIPVRALALLTNLSPSMLTRTRSCRSRPRLRNQRMLKSILQRLGML